MRNVSKCFDLVIVGGGSGGVSVAGKCRKLFKKIAVIEPNDRHYYQPLFTLVGAGIKPLEQSSRPIRDILPHGSELIQDAAIEFLPAENLVRLQKSGDFIQYRFLVCALGLRLDYDRIPGLVESLEDPTSGVCSNYSPLYVRKTYDVMKRLRSGNAIFTFPNTPIKCPGAPQKVCYLTEDYLRKNQLRSKSKIIYCTSLPVIFSVKKYADSLWKIVKEREIDVHLRTNLVAVNASNSVATFENLDDPKSKMELEFSMLHVTPPMSTPPALKNNTELVNAAGFLDVDHLTLQHCRYRNIFGIGDCMSTPNAKTAAAIAVQSDVLVENLKSFVQQRPLQSSYNGYSSCPLITSYNRCILAEFDYDFKPLETFPYLKQDRERTLFYWLKVYALPFVYWRLMVRGLWSGPNFRKMLRSFFSN